MSDSKKMEEQKAAVEQKKRNFVRLRNDLLSGQCPKGTTDSVAREKYGEPDSVYHSGSSESSFEIWTYEKITDKNDPEGLHPIRLYFDNGRLISWKF